MPDLGIETTQNTALTDIKNRLKEYYAPETLGDILQSQLISIEEGKKSQEGIDTERIQATTLYFTQEDKRLGMSPIQKITEVYGLLSNQAHAADIQDHAKVLLKLAFEQQLENPPQYLSHGFDHTMNVLRYTETVIDQNPYFIEAMTKKYQLTPEVARFMLLNVAFFHDFGYPSVGNRGKSVHSLIGAEIASQAKMQELHTKLLLLQNEELLKDFSKAILYHNADSKKQVFQTKLSFGGGELLLPDITDIDTVTACAQERTLGALTEIVTTDQNAASVLKESLQKAGLNIPVETLTAEENNYTPFFVGRPFDRVEKSDQRLGLEYREVDPVQDPMAAIIRLADNMDIAKSRFVGIQDEEGFKAIYKAMSDGEPDSMLYTRLEEGDESAIPEVTQIMYEGKTGGTPQLNLTEALKEWKYFLAHRILREQYGDLPEEIRSEIIDNVQYLDGNQLKHWGGCDTITDVSFKGSTLTVIVDAERYEKYSKISVTEKAKDQYGNEQMIALNVGIYQIWRAQEAFSGIRFDQGHGINIKVIDTEGKSIPIPGITENYLD